MARRRFADEDPVFAEHSYGHTDDYDWRASREPRASPAGYGGPRAARVDQAAVRRSRLYGTEEHELHDQFAGEGDELYEELENDQGYGSQPQAFAAAPGRGGARAPAAWPMHRDRPPAETAPQPRAPYQRSYEDEEAELQRREFEAQRIKRGYGARAGGPPEEPGWAAGEEFDAEAEAYPEEYDSRFGHGDRAPPPPRGGFRDPYGGGRGPSMAGRPYGPGLYRDDFGEEGEQWDEYDDDPRGPPRDHYGGPAGAVPRGYYDERGPPAPAHRAGRKQPYAGGAPADEPRDLSRGNRAADPFDDPRAAAPSQAPAPAQPPAPAKPQESVPAERGALDEKPVRPLATGARLADLVGLVKDKQAVDEMAPRRSAGGNSSRAAPGAEGHETGGVYIGGTASASSEVVAYLKRAGVPFYAAESPTGAEGAGAERDAAARGRCPALFYALDGRSRCLLPTLEAAEAVASGRTVVLCMQKVSEGAAAELPDAGEVNRARAALEELASRHRVPVYTEPLDALSALLALPTDPISGAFLPMRAGGAPRAQEPKIPQGSGPPEHVYLAGAGAPATWRREVAEPALQAAGLTYFNPFSGEGRPQAPNLDALAKERAACVLSVVDGRARCLPAMVEAVELACNGRNVVLVVEELKAGTPVGQGGAVSEAEAAEHAAARRFVRGLAVRHGAPVLPDVRAAVDAIARTAHAHAGRLPYLRPAAASAPAVQAGNGAPPAAPRGGGEAPRAPAAGPVDSGAGASFPTPAPATPAPAPAAAAGPAATRETGGVYLGGAAAYSSEAAAFLRRNGVPFYAAESPTGAEGAGAERDAAARGRCPALFYALDGRSRCLLPTLEAAEAVASGRTVVLCLQQVEDGAKLDGPAGPPAEPSAVRELCLARDILGFMADRHGVPVYADPAQALSALLSLPRDPATGSFLPTRPGGAPRAQEPRIPQGSRPPEHVFLAGSGAPATWRKEIAEPALAEGRLTYFDPEAHQRREDASALQAMAKERAACLLYVIDSRTRSLVPMVESVEYVCNGRNIVLVIEQLAAGTLVGRERVSPAEAAEQAAARRFLRGLAGRHGAPVLPDVRAAVDAIARTAHAHAGRLPYLRPPGQLRQSLSLPLGAARSPSGAGAPNPFQEPPAGTRHAWDEPPAPAPARPANDLAALRGSALTAAAAAPPPSGAPAAPAAPSSSTGRPREPWEQAAAVAPHEALREEYARRGAAEYYGEPPHSPVDIPGQYRRGKTPARDSSLDLDRAARREREREEKARQEREAHEHERQLRLARRRAEAGRASAADEAILAAELRTLEQEEPVRALLSEAPEVSDFVHFNRTVDRVSDLRYHQEKAAVAKEPPKREPPRYMQGLVRETREQRLAREEAERRAAEEEALRLARERPPPGGPARLLHAGHRAHPLPLALPAPAARAAPPAPRGPPPPPRRRPHHSAEGHDPAGRAGRTAAVPRTAGRPVPAWARPASRASSGSGPAENIDALYYRPSPTRGRGPAPRPAGGYESPFEDEGTDWYREARAGPLARDWEAPAPGDPIDPDVLRKTDEILSVLRQQQSAMAPRVGVSAATPVRPSALLARASVARKAAGETPARSSFARSPSPPKGAWTDVLATSTKRWEELSKGSTAARNERIRASSPYFRAAGSDEEGAGGEAEEAGASELTPGEILRNLRKRQEELLSEAHRVGIADRLSFAHNGAR
eukprot:tig00020909_g15346.t1